MALFAAVLAFFTAGGTVLPGRVAVRGRTARRPTRIGVGVAIGAFAIAALLLRPVVGWASDRFGRRPLLLLGGVLTVVALAAPPRRDVARRCSSLVAGAARDRRGFFFVAALAAISDLAPPDRRGEAINFGSLPLYRGLAIGPVLGETILGLGGLRRRLARGGGDRRRGDRPVPARPRDGADRPRATGRPDGPAAGSSTRPASSRGS